MTQYDSEVMQQSQTHDMQRYRFYSFKCGWISVVGLVGDNYFYCIKITMSVGISKQGHTKKTQMEIVIFF